MIRVVRKEHVDEWKQHDNHANRAQPACVSIVTPMPHCRRPQPAVFFFETARSTTGGFFCTLIDNNDE